jgi:2-keto-4-pentenoate hydratase
MIDIAQAVEEFWRSREGGVYFPPEWEDRLTVDDAYYVQLGMMERHVALGARHVGWKVGLTAEPIQRQFRLDEPVFGYLLDEAPHPDGASFRFDELISPGVENEICMTMGSDLSGPIVTEDDALAAVALVQPSLEITEARGDFTRHLPLALADNAQQKAIVQGRPTPLGPGELDLRKVRVAVSINGEQVAEGVGESVMGHPIRSVVWLANKLAAYGRRLEAGQLIMSGSLTRQLPVSRGDTLIARFEPLGSVGASFP